MGRFVLHTACNADLGFAAATLWHSIAAHWKGPRPIPLLAFLDDDVTDLAERKLHDFAGAIGIELTTWRAMDLPRGPRERLVAMGEHRSPNWRPALARLVVPDAMTDVERLLYFDVDTLAVDDLSEARTLDLGDAVMGAVQAPLAVVQGRVGADPYLNSGMLLVDVAKWQAQDVGPRCAQWIIRDRGASPMADQDALNVVLDPRTGDPAWRPLDPGWNTLTPLFIPRGELAYAMPDRVRLLHFAGPLKPWRHPEHPFAALYAKHLKAVPFQPNERSTGLFA